MKKKSITVMAALIGLLACMFGLAACGDDQPAYYNRTFTLTGKSVIDWTGKNYSDIYGNDDGDSSQKQIIERHWDKIDWSDIEIPHATVDEFIQSFDKLQNSFYADAKDLKISVKKSDRLTLTLNLPAGIRADYPADITMDFAETEGQFAEIKQRYGDLNDFAPMCPFEEGYSGIGVYQLQNKYLIVKFSSGKYVNKITLDIDEMQKDTSGGLIQTDSLFKTTESPVTLYDSSANQIWDIRQKIDYVAENS